MEQLKIFSSEEFGEIRTAIVEEMPMFCLADICKALELSQPSKVKERLSEKGVSSIPTLTSGGVQNMLYVNESNLYKVIFQSRKESAEHFTDWVTSEVLPSIRSHGMYAIDTLLDNPDLLIQVAIQLKEEREARRIAEQEQERLQTELEYSKEWYSIKRVAAINGVDWKKFDWRKLKRTGIEMGYDIKKIFDANYGEVNTYHRDVWEKVYPEYEL